jgi:7-carboxy-7-deazaguanine synthase
MTTDRVLPISEIFESLQGEGQYVGTPMLFVRLAGCNVGKPAKALKVGPFPLLHTGREASACCTYDGRIFPCDTDYSLSAKVPVSEILHKLETTGLRHVCVTGGEPFLHAELIEELFLEINKREIQLHVETSGTLLPRSIWEHLIVPGYWITCSPKLNALREMISRADELKILVDEDFDEYKLTPEMLNHPNVFLCPVNGVEMNGGNNPGNVRRCVDLLKRFPQWRLSIQVHKLFGWR